MYDIIWTIIKEEIFATRREKSMLSPRKSDDVITLGDVMKFGLTFSGRSIIVPIFIPNQLFLAVLWRAGTLDPSPNTNLHEKAQY